MTRSAPAIPGRAASCSAAPTIPGFDHFGDELGKFGEGGVMRELPAIRVDTFRHVYRDELGKALGQLELTRTWVRIAGTGIYVLVECAPASDSPGRAA